MTSPRCVELIKGFLTVLSGFFLQLTTGHMLTFPNMNTYITSYLNTRIDSSIHYKDSIWINSTVFLGRGLLIPFGGYLNKHLGSRKTCLLGAVIFSGSIASTAYTIHYGLFAVTLTYGILSGFGTGLIYSPSLFAGVKWFPERKGLVVGIVSAGSGIGPLILSPLQTFFLNHKNITPNQEGYFTCKELLDKVPLIFPYLGGIYGIIQLVCILSIFTPYPSEREDTKMTNYRSICDEGTNMDTRVNHELCHMNNDDHFQLQNILRTSIFYNLTITASLLYCCVIFVLTTVKAYGQTFIVGDYFLSVVTALAGLSTFLASLLWGYFVDKFGYKVCMAWVTASTTALMLTFTITSYSGKILYIAWVMSTYFAITGLFVLIPAVCDHILGDKNAGILAGLVFILPSISGIFAALGVQFVYKCFGWFGSFCFIAFLSFIALITTLLYSETAMLPPV